MDVNVLCTFITRPDDRTGLAAITDIASVLGFWRLGRGIRQEFQGRRVGSRRGICSQPTSVGSIFARVHAGLTQVEFRSRWTEKGVIRGSFNEVEKHTPGLDSEPRQEDSFGHPSQL